MNINYAFKLYASHKRLSPHLIIAFSLILKPLGWRRTLFTFVLTSTLIMKADKGAGCAGELNLKPRLHTCWRISSCGVLMIYRNQAAAESGWLRGERWKNKTGAPHVGKKSCDVIIVFSPGVTTLYLVLSTKGASNRALACCFFSHQCNSACYMFQGWKPSYVSRLAKWRAKTRYRVDLFVFFFLTQYLVWGSLSPAACIWSVEDETAL